MNDNYYWILPYAKKRGTFFASDIKNDMEKNDIYFNIAIIRSAIDWWIQGNCIKVLDTKYFIRSGSQQVNKYVYVKDPK